MTTTTTGEGATVLTIDDDDLVRRVFVTCLQMAGFEVVEAANGLAGLERFRSDAPDVVLCDLRMPQLDGLEVLSAITEESPETPVIVVSGEGTMIDAVEALKRGAWDFVTKPLHDPEFLVQSVRRALEKSELQRENRAYRAHLEELNQQLSRALAELRADQEAGRKVQFQLLPREAWQVGAYVFDRRIFPSKYLSGDFVDYFPLEEGRTGMYVADVSGHGAASAFVTAMLTTLIGQYREAMMRGESDILLHPERLLSAVDKDIGTQNLGKHLTMFYAVLDDRTDELSFANGGHFPFPVLFDGETTRFLDCPGRPLGLFPDSTFSSQRIRLAPSARLLVASDGVLELGSERPLEERKAALAALLGPDTTTDSVVNGLGLREIPELRDDVTMLLVRRGVKDG